MAKVELKAPVVAEISEAIKMCIRDSPKAGTVTMEVTKAINDIKACKIEYRLDKSNIVHVPVGKASFTEEKLLENFNALMDAITKAKPSACLLYTSFHQAE